MTIAPWLAAGFAGGLAIVAGLADRARRLRADLDRVGWIDWRTVQMAAMLALLLVIAAGAGLR